VLTGCDPVTVIMRLCNGVVGEKDAHSPRENDSPEATGASANQKKGRRPPLTVRLPKQHRQPLRGHSGSPHERCSRSKGPAPRRTTPLETTLKRSRFEPGDRAPASGIYVERGPRGAERSEVTVPKGHIFPPTSTPGGSFELRRPALNKSGKGSK
jgi:hypothetical protein